MRSSCLVLALALECLLPLGCARLAPNAPDSGHGDAWDAVFRRRHVDPKAPVCNDPMLSLAREVTVLEDDIRRDGSITVKTPDVWGDADLMHYIREYDALLAKSVDGFNETLQAYIARSDQMELQSATGLGMAVGGGTAPVAAPTTVSIDNKGAMSSTGTLTPELKEITKLPPSEVISKALAGAPAKTKDGIGVEPTELERQRSTFILVNQALRRRNTGDDGSRAAGYGLYKFRIPVSILPGRETHQGHSAVVTLRAQLHVDEAHLRYTFPKLVIADLVDTLTPVILDDWNRDEPKPEPRAPVAKQRFDQPRAMGAQAFPITGLSPVAVFGDSIDDLRHVAKKHFDGVRPKPLELRNYLFKYLGQVHGVLNARQSYANPRVETGDETAVNIIQSVGQIVEKGHNPTKPDNWRNCWITGVKGQVDSAADVDPETERFPSVSWLVAVQSGILNQNLKRILTELQLRGKLSDDPKSFASVQFFNPDANAVRLWDILVRETFPLHVFALDPQVEEQNAYDAFSRRREMQLALAISVASGRINAGQKVALSRQIALDEATIALNRTAVAFSHGSDTFGWYFHPRVQTPPTESSNIAALGRMIWSTGPTECYDLKHRKLEPGMRECEVLVAMPSFVTEVSFDVTTNWEAMARPGVTKRSYEEMVAQGGRLHRLRMCRQEAGNQQCYRPGDYARLLSRIDQLEQMLGMQTYMVSVPYEYEQTGTDLFDTGKAHLRPVLHGYYGLEFIQGDDGTAAFVFLTGKNFHPTLTHVIVGGSESHSLVPDDCEVVSRDLLRVKINKVNSKLSRAGQFEVRVATPAGLSEALPITAAPAPAPAPAPAASDFDWKIAPVFKATLGPRAEGSGAGVSLDLKSYDASEETFTIVNQTSRLPMPIATPELVLNLTVKFTSGGGRNLGTTKPVKMIGRTDKALSVDPAEVIGVINDVIAEGAMNRCDEREGAVTGTAYLKFDQWPYIKLDKQVTVDFKPMSSKDKGNAGQSSDGARVLPLPPADRPAERISIGLGNPGSRGPLFPNP